MTPFELQVTRRKFFQQSSALALAASAGLAGAGEKSANPFAYDVGALGQTDPKLLQYEQVSQFSCPHGEPRRLALGPDGRLYIGTLKGVSVLDSNGGLLSELSLEQPVLCLTVAPDGVLYAGLREQVQVFGPKGALIATWAVPGKKTWLSGLSAGAKELFMADSGNRVVLRYDRSGKPLGRLGEKDKARNVPGLVVPSPNLDVKLAPDGLVRVNNFGRHCVEVYTPAGDLEFSWGKASAAIEGFCGCCNPVGLALLADGRYVTSEKGFPRAKVYSAQGEFECVVAGPEGFAQNARAGAADCAVGGLDVAAQGLERIYLLDRVTAQVRLLKRKA